MTETTTTPIAAASTAVAAVAAAANVAFCTSPEHGWVATVVCLAAGQWLHSPRPPAVGNASADAPANKRAACAVETNAIP